VHVEQVESLAELFKYVTKLAPIVANPELVDVFMRATHRVKLVRCYGSFYDLAVEGEDKAQPECCPDCGSTEIEHTGRVYPEQVWFDRNGVIRFDSEETDAPEFPPARGPDAMVSDESLSLRYEHPRLFADAAD
jgi:hypothetical protein